MELQKSRHQREREQMAQYELEMRREDIARMKMLGYCAWGMVIVICGVIVFLSN